MNKIWLVIMREYITRVRNRTFLLSTFLTPLLFVGLIAAVAYFTAGDSPRQNPMADAMIGENSIPDNEKSLVAYLAGYIASFLVYFTILIYGTMVMRGVSEEKTSRIAEIIVSSVKPFQLMMGKIIGIGAVGLTQFLLWIILMLVFSSVLFIFLPGSAPAQTAQLQETALLQSLSEVNFPLLTICFLFYFLFGYLFYAALFAAIGSAVNEDAQDTQSLMMPVTMPIVLAIVIMMQVIQNPSGSLATWSSMIPFLSPVVMMARIPFGVPEIVPWWELLLSMAILLAGFILTTWLSARIYRVNILLYGKKITWKEMWKWTFRS